MRNIEPMDEKIASNTCPHLKESGEGSNFSCLHACFFSTLLAAVLAMWQAWSCHLTPTTAPKGKAELSAIWRHQLNPADYQVTWSLTSPFLRDPCELEMERLRFKTQLQAKVDEWAFLPQASSGQCVKSKLPLYLIPPCFLSNSHFSVAILYNWKEQKSKNPNLKIKVIYVIFFSGRDHTFGNTCENKKHG